MALTSEQLHVLTEIANRDGRDCGYGDVGYAYDASMILGRIFDLARLEALRPEVDLRELVTHAELPAAADQRSLVTSWWRSWAVARGFAAHFENHQPTNGGNT